jgi:hypothetical protein
MTETDDPQHRAYHHSDPDRVTLREAAEDEDDVFSVRMPIASTGEVRNEGDDPLTRDELAGMAEQIESRSVGVFLDHGASALGGGGGMFGNRYSAVGKVGEWANPDVVDTNDGDGPALLEADARLMDPETLPAATGDVRESLAALKSQVERGFALASSIAWRQDDAYPGGNDLMEASIVGIGADPRTVSDTEAAVARAAVDAGADPEAFLSELRAVVMGPDTERDMSDDDTEPDAESGTDQDDEQTEERDAPEWAQDLLEEQQRQTELLRDVHDAVREDDEDEDDEEDDDSEDQEGDTDGDEDDEDDEEQAADADDEQERDGDADDLGAKIEQLRVDLDEARESGNIETPDVDADDEEQRETTSDTDTDGPNWRA